MKEKFLALVKEVKNTGIAEALYKTSNAKELEAVWQKFSDENQELFGKIKDWAEEFRISDGTSIFSKAETIENPMEIAILIRIINDKNNVSEFELFENWGDFVEAIHNIGNDFSDVIEDLIWTYYITDIKPQYIFDDDSDDENDDETDSEEN